MGTDVLERILLVEDEPDIQTVTRLSLEALGGFKVEVCASGQEAIEAAPRFSPDLILLDAMMPGMDGVSTLRALRELVKLDVPVVFLTAKAQPQEIVQYKELGALDVITKPFDPMTLPGKIRKIWTARERKELGPV